MRTLVDDASPMHLAILDQRGLIVSTNRAWDAFARRNGFAHADFGRGSNYLDICRAVTGDCAGDALLVADGVEAVLSGAATDFRMIYSCHSPDAERWFSCRVEPLPPLHGAVVLHVNVTQRMQRRGGEGANGYRPRRAAPQPKPARWRRAPAARSCCSTGKAPP